MEEFLKVLKHEAAELKSHFSENPRLAEMFEKCYLSTAETTVKRLDDGSLFVITGDIPAMWLRDSSAQVQHYMPAAQKSAVVRELIEDVVKKQFFYINLDPYSNAFNEAQNGRHYALDNSGQTDWTWERKYEMDSLSFPVSLAYKLWREAGTTAHLDETAHSAMRLIVETFKCEQNHEEKSPYRFERETDKATETLSRGGLGAKTAYTGMTWSGFRPSDDACTYGYSIPENMFAAVALSYISTISKEIWQDDTLAEAADALRKEILDGIEKYGTVETERFGKIYAFEVDGLGNKLIIEDANIPGILSAPYFGFCDINDDIYQNTRRMALSDANTYYFKGKALTGIGSVHSKPNRVWPISLITQAMTAKTQAERDEIIKMLISTDDGTGYMHEAIDKDDPSIYTRPWFAWANSYFCELLMTNIGLI
ncbi:MAG: glycoside hydrolase family 125 protein [Ruminococcaceae bacterium]|nr:glycoside hydrolase family 125 protein [Oscillospiraceae bacterium]